MCMCMSVRPSVCQCAIARIRWAARATGSLDIQFELGMSNSDAGFPLTGRPLAGLPLRPLTRDHLASRALCLGTATPGKYQPTRESGCTRDGGRLGRHRLAYTKTDTALYGTGGPLLRAEIQSALLVGNLNHRCMKSIELNHISSGRALTQARRQPVSPQLNALIARLP